MAGELVVDKQDKIAHIQVNRPKQMNSLNPALMAQLSAAFREADQDDGIKVIVLSGVGSNFGAGYDLKFDWTGHFGGPAPMNVRNMLRACVEFEFTPWNCDKPVIAMVRGYCLAGSCELAMMCCITFASETSKFGEPEIRFSNSPPALVMPWIVGLKKARELLYTGDMIDAQEAHRIGMVNQVFPDGKLEEETFRYARRAAAISLEGLKTTKTSIKRAAEIAGFQQAIESGIEIGTMLDTTETEVARKFDEVQRKEGLGAAIRWRERQFE
ncbi:MAG: enoyl-CoA hydratase/isomerase family protein [Acidobacteriota bacterium]